MYVHIYTHAFIYRRMHMYNHTQTYMHAHLYTHIYERKKKEKSEETLSEQAILKIRTPLNREIMSILNQVRNVVTSVKRQYGTIWLFSSNANVLRAIDNSKPDISTLADGVFHE